MSSDSPAQGFRVVSHTADEIVEAWGPTREACLEEAARGLLATVVDVGTAGWSEHVEVPLSGTDEELLLDLLEELVFRLDTDGGVPVRIRARRAHGGVVVDLWLTDRHHVREIGAAPKGIAYSGLAFAEDAQGAWRCRVTVDV